MRGGRIRDLKPGCAENLNSGSYPSAWFSAVSLGLSPPRGRARSPGASRPAFRTRKLPRGGGRSSSSLPSPPLPIFPLPPPPLHSPRLPSPRLASLRPAARSEVQDSPLFSIRWSRPRLPPPASPANCAQAPCSARRLTEAPEEVRPRSRRAEMAGPPSGLAPEPGQLWVLQVPLSFSPPHVVAAEDCRGFSGTQA